MKCSEARRYASPYLDSDLDDTTTFDVSRHLEGCPACARWFEAQERVEKAIVASLRKTTGDEESVFDRALDRAVPRRGGRHRGLLFALGGAVAAAAAGLVLALALGGDEPPALLVMASLDHSKFVRGDLALEIESADPDAVDRFLRDRAVADESPLPGNGDFTLEGARLCRFRGLKVGYVALRHRATPISLFTVSANEARAMSEALEHASGTPCFELAGGRGLVRRTPGGYRAVFGDVGLEALEAAARSGN